MKYEADGMDVWFDHRIFAKCTRYEDASKIALVLNGKPVKKKPVVKKKVRKKHG